jgi:hypothetical protein
MNYGDFSLCSNSPCLPAAGGQRDLVGALGQGCANCDSPVEGALLVTSCDEESVTLRWSIEGLSRFAGLSIYRATEDSGQLTRLNRELLPALSPGSYVDATVWPATTFHYQLRAVFPDGGEVAAGGDVCATTPGRLSTVLRSPCPNPFSDRCVFELDLPSGSNRATVGVFDVAGRRVASLHDAPLSRGRHEFLWDGYGDGGNHCAAGIYFVRCEAADLKLLQRVTLLK